MVMMMLIVLMMLLVLMLPTAPWSVSTAMAESSPGALDVVAIPACAHNNEYDDDFDDCIGDDDGENVDYEDDNKHRNEDYGDVDDDDHDHLVVVDLQPPPPLE